MNRSQLQRIIKEELRRVLKEGQEPITLQPQNELFGFGATKLKEGDKISMTIEPKAGFGAKGQIDKYEMEVIQTAVGGVKVDVYKQVPLATR